MRDVLNNARINMGMAPLTVNAEESPPAEVEDFQPDNDDNNEEEEF
ncbi:hypothetical protein GM528_12355 [Streptococcus pneumoniae]|nr:hypothetical protein [Streptococcus pneumoniae]